MALSEVIAVELVKGRALKDAWILCIRTETQQFLFRWIAFYRTGVFTPWAGEAPPPRAERARTEVERAISDARATGAN